MVPKPTVLLPAASKDAEPEVPVAAGAPSVGVIENSKDAGEKPSPLTVLVSRASRAVSRVTLVA